MATLKTAQSAPYDMKSTTGRVRSGLSAYQKHADFNKVVLARNYPGPADDFEGFMRERSDRFNVGFVEGFESFTSQNSMALLHSGLYEHKRSEPHFAGLFKWHLIEEIEHRNVAFDIYEHLYGNSLVRASLCWVAQHHLFSFYADCLRIMSAAEGERAGAPCCRDTRPTKSRFRPISQSIPII